MALGRFAARAGGRFAAERGLVGAAAITGENLGKSVAVGAAEGSVQACKTAGQLGREGEAAVRNVYDIGDKVKFEINGKARFPDGFSRVANTVSEVKNVGRQGFTRQLRAYSDFAQERGLQFDLYTRSDTTFTRPLQDAIDSGLINHLHIPGL